MHRAASSPKRVLVQLALWSCLIAVLAVVHMVDRRGVLEGRQRLFLIPEVHAQPATGPAKAADGMEMAKPAAAMSTSLTVTVNGKPTKFSVVELKAMPQKTVKVHNEHTNVDETYSGVELADVLAKCGFVVGKTAHQEITRGYIKAEGTDKYWTIYSAIEVEPSEHSGDVIVATSINGKSLGADGALKLISTDDKKPQRWVRNLTAIALRTAE
jgi:hypothetical protein